MTMTTDFDTVPNLLDASGADLSRILTAEDVYALQHADHVCVRTEFHNGSNPTTIRVMVERNSSPTRRFVECFKVNAGASYGDRVAWERYVGADGSAENFTGGECGDGIKARRIDFTHASELLYLRYHDGCVATAFKLLRPGDRLHFRWTLGNDSGNDRARRISRDELRVQHFRGWKMVGCHFLAYTATDPHDNTNRLGKVR